MPKTFYEHLDDVAKRQALIPEEEIKKSSEAAEALRLLLSGERTGVDFYEAAGTMDFPLMFTRVATELMMQPVEPAYIGQTILSTTLPVGDERIVEIPAMGALEAYEIGERQEYPQQTLAFYRNAVTVQIRKWGLAVGISEELLRKSMWPFIGMHVDAARAALIRKKEQVIFDTFEDMAWTVIDNQVAFSTTFGTTPGFDSTPEVPSLATRGRGVDGIYNGTPTIQDIIDMVAGVIINGYTPTDILMNPLTWAMLAKDPVIRAMTLNGTDISQWPPLKASSAGTQGDTLAGNSTLGSWAQAISPFGLTLTPTKFVSVVTSYEPYTTSIFVGQRKAGLMLLQGEGPTTDQYEDPKVDTTHLKMKEWWGVGMLDQGRAWCQAKNVVIADQYDYSPLISLTKSI